jgi:hypothetical protein
MQQDRNPVNRLLAVLLACSMAAVGWLGKSVSDLKTENEMLVQQLQTVQRLPGSTPTPKPVTKTITRSAPLPTAIMVYISRTGSRYHDSKECAGDAPRQVTLQDAKNRGYTQCQRCLPPK